MQKRDFMRGDLVDIREPSYRYAEVSTKCGALVLEYASSNVYEPAYCEVLYQGDIFHVKTRYLYFSIPVGVKG
jgi:hypothetical protein